MAEELGGFAAAEADPADCQDGAVKRQGGERGGKVLPRDPAVGGEGQKGVFPRFADIEEEVGVAGGGELGRGKFEGGFRWG